MDAFDEDRSSIAQLIETLYLACEENDENGVVCIDALSAAGNLRDELFADGVSVEH